MGLRAPYPRFSCLIRLPAALRCPAFVGSPPACKLAASGWWLRDVSVFRAASQDRELGHGDFQFSQHHRFPRLSMVATMPASTRHYALLVWKTLATALEKEP